MRKVYYQGHFRLSQDRFGAQISCVHCRWVKMTSATATGLFGRAIVFGHFVNHVRECHPRLHYEENRKHHEGTPTCKKEEEVMKLMGIPARFIEIRPCPVCADATTKGLIPPAGKDQDELQGISPARDVWEHRTWQGKLRHKFALRNLKRINISHSVHIKPSAGSRARKQGVRDDHNN